MTQEEKELLLKDLCARLLYGVKCQFIWTYSNETTDGESIIAKEDDNIRCINIHIKEIQADYYDEWVDLEHCKPYLRPMSSMTEEEKHKLLKFGAITCLENGEVIDVSCVGFERHADVQDYLNTCYLDYRGLIPMGLALEAPEGMYKKWTSLRGNLKEDNQGNIVGGLKL